MIVAYGALVRCVFDLSKCCSMLTTTMLLCHDLPVWFREQFRKHLNECQTSGFGRRWACIGDSRTMKEIESDAKRHGEILERLAPEILQMLKMKHWLKRQITM